ncbi:MAG: DNA primase [Burkholderiaceae bacterium]|nr:DNA primase [Burkholderiaceae bacterium]
MIPESFISEVLSRTDIVEVIGRYVKLQRKGVNYMACCPFHKEKTPSFAVNQSRQFFKCFGCGESGSAIAFLMKYKGLSFPDAIKELADALGMEVPEDKETKRRAAEARSLTDFMAQAAQFYQSTLFHNREAIEYLKGRGITQATAEKFQLGLSPDGWQGLQTVFGDQYPTESKLEECGLVIVKDDRRYDRFRSRIMYPIRNPRGQVIGFGARTMVPGEEPKYLNSPETPIYHKSQELYGLFEGREAIRKKGRAIVCEGYMDVIQMSQAGFEETVAALGTSITGEHVKKLFQLSDHVYFSFDGDSAGFKAARRAMESTLSVITDTQTAHFVILPQGEDPDSLIKAQGPEAFEAQIKGSYPLSKFFVMDIIREVTQGSPLKTAEERAKAVAIAKPLLLRMTAQALRQLLVQELATSIRMEPAELATLCGVALVKETPKAEKYQRDYGRDAQQSARYKRPTRPVTTGPIYSNIKRRLLQCFLMNPQWFVDYSDQIEYEMLDTVDEWESLIVQLWRLVLDQVQLLGDGVTSGLSTGYLLSFMQNDPAYSTLSQLVSQEEVLQTPNEVAEFEIKCSFLKLEKANVDASITELLAMEERGENVDGDYLERLFKRRQLIQQSLMQQSAQAVDMVLTTRLGG